MLVLGMALAFGLGMAANEISGNSIGLSAKPLQPGEELAPPAANRSAERSRRRHRSQPSARARQHGRDPVSPVAPREPGAEAGGVSGSGSRGGEGSSGEGGSDDRSRHSDSSGSGSGRSGSGSDDPGGDDSDSRADSGSGSLDSGGDDPADEPADGRGSDPDDD